MGNDKSFKKRVKKSKEECSKWSGDKEGLSETVGQTLWKDDELAEVIGYEVVSEFYGEEMQGECRKHRQHHQ